MFPSRDRWNSYTGIYLGVPCCHFVRINPTVFPVFPHGSPSGNTRARPVRPSYSRGNSYMRICCCVPCCHVVVPTTLTVFPALPHGRMSGEHTREHTRDQVLPFCSRHSDRVSAGTRGTRNSYILFLKGCTMEFLIAICLGVVRLGVGERVCCLLALDSVTSTPQWIRQPTPPDETKGGGDAMA